MKQECVGIVCLAAAVLRIFPILIHVHWRDSRHVLLITGVGIEPAIAGPQERAPRALQSADKRRIIMRRIIARKREEGKVGWLVLWLLGVPIPVLVILFLLRGCT